MAAPRKHLSREDILGALPRRASEAITGGEVRARLGVTDAKAARALDRALCEMSRAGRSDGDAPVVGVVRDVRSRGGAAKRLYRRD